MERANTKTIPTFTISRSQNRFLKKQDIHADHDGYQREHVKHDGCLSYHPSFLVRAAERSQSGAWIADDVF